jgi:hypothetical protein
MSAADPPAVLTEITDQGEQVLAPGIAPVSLRERLERLLAAPLRPIKPQKPLNIGLFDEDARTQLDLF